MPNNLSFNKNKSVENFYTLIQKQILKEIVKSKKQPNSHDDFEEWIKINKRKYFKKKCKILEIGPGFTGNWLKILKKNNFQNLYALDINTETVKELKKLKFINVKHGSILNLPYKDNYFDFVICYGVIHHTSNPLKAFNEVFRVTKKNGYSYIGLYLFRNSVFEYIVRIWRIIGKYTSYKIVHKLVKNVSSLNRFFLDHTYVPILNLYNSNEVEQIFKKKKFTIVEDKANNFDFFQRIPLIGKIMTGSGLLRYYFVKKN